MFELVLAEFGTAGLVIALGAVAAGVAWVSRLALRRVSTHRRRFTLGSRPRGLSILLWGLVVYGALLLIGLPIAEYQIGGQKLSFSDVWSLEHGPLVILSLVSAGAYCIAAGLALRWRALGSRALAASTPTVAVAATLTTPLLERTAADSFPLTENVVGTVVCTLLVAAYVFGNARVRAHFASAGGSAA